MWLYFASSRSFASTFTMAKVSSSQRNGENSQGRLVWC